MIEFRKGLDPIFQKRAPKPAAPTPSSRPSASKPALSPVGRGSYLSFPIYTVRAGPHGEFAYEGAPLGEVIIETVTIGGRLYRIHSLREWPEVVLRPAVYRWLQVQGDSMEKAHPASILQGDCVLMIDTPLGNYSPQPGDIVVAARRTSIGSEAELLIKQFTPKGLCSESNTPYQTIPLRQVIIRGLAIAVAKPV